MWRLVVLLIGAAMAGESGPEIEYPEIPIEYSPLPREEDAPLPLPGMLYPRESESREVIAFYTVAIIYLEILDSNFRKLECDIQFT